MEKAGRMSSKMASPIFRRGRTVATKCVARRYLSDVTAREIPHKKNKKRNNSIIFYRRNSNYNGRLKAGTAFCLVNTTYWSWYAERCISFKFFGVSVPFFISIDTGMYGFTTALLFNYFGYTYASQLVSKMTYNREMEKVEVFGHRFWKESDQALECNLGEICLDRHKKEVKWLLEKLGGDATQFRGYLPLRVRADHYNSRWPHLVYCNDEYEVKDADAFLEALLFDIEPEGEDEYGEDEDVPPKKSEEKVATLRNIPRKFKKSSRRRSIRSKRR